MKEKRGQNQHDNYKMYTYLQRNPTSFEKVQVKISINYQTIQGNNRYYLSVCCRLNIVWNLNKIIISLQLC